MSFVCLNCFCFVLFFVCFVFIFFRYSVFFLFFNNFYLSHMSLSLLPKMINGFPDQYRNHGYISFKINIDPNVVWNRFNHCTWIEWMMFSKGFLWWVPFHFVWRVGEFVTGCLYLEDRGVTWWSGMCGDKGMRGIFLRAGLHSAMSPYAWYDPFGRCIAESVGLT